MRKGREMQVLRAADHRRMAWKNGAGETMEVAVFPPDAGLGDFDWRVSMARVGADGPFSGFAGVDRTLAVLDGAGLILSVEGMEPAELLSQSEPLAFPADVPTQAMLIEGPITDLNVMTRRDRLQHRLFRHELDGAAELPVVAETVLLLCQRGEVRVTAAGETARLGPLDAAVVGPEALRVEGKGRFYLAAIGPHVSV